MTFISFVSIQTLIGAVILPLLTVAAGIALVRLARGPSLPDRIVALDLMSMLGIGMAVTYAALTGQRSLVDVAMVIALLTFLGTVAISLYIQRKEDPWDTGS